MRRLRWLELGLALSLLALLLIAGWFRPIPGPSTGVSDERKAVPAPAPQGEVLSAAASDPRPVLDAAAERHGVDRFLVEALAFWESGWDQSRVSSTGAVGLMQVQPETAARIGPGLDLRRPADNVELGLRVLTENLRRYGGDRRLALAAYYQGPGALDQDGWYPDTLQYVTGIEALADRFARGEGPPPVR